MPADSEAGSTGRVILGRLGSPFGVKGWLRVQSYARPPEQIFEYPRWCIGEGERWTELALEEVRPQGKGWIARLTGIADREAAAALTGASVSIPREALPPAEEGAYYWMDLVGLRVVGLDGLELGRVVSLMETGANDVLVVQGDEERLIPFLQPEVIRRIDLSQSVIEVDWDPEF